MHTVIRYVIVYKHQKKKKTGVGRQLGLIKRICTGDNTHFFDVSLLNVSPTIFSYTGILFIFIFCIFVQWSLNYSVVIVNQSSPDGESP